MQYYLLAITIFLISLIQNVNTESMLRILQNNDKLQKVSDANPFSKCTRENCPEEFGICLKSNKCSCFKGYITINNPKFGNTSCNYKQKSQLKAFLLEFLISFGAGHFYLENINIGLMKLITCLMFVTLLCFSTRCLRCFHNTKMEDIFPYLQSLFVLIFCVWQIYDTFMIGMKNYTDGNHVEMMS